MDKGLLFRAIALYALVLALGAGFTFAIHRDSRALYDETVPLVERGLPTLATLSALRAAVVAQEPILYEYYATVDRERFQLRWAGNRAVIDDEGEKVRRDFPGHPRIAAIDRHDARITVLAGRLDTILGARPVDWDEARAVLEEISRHALEINANLDMLADDVHARVGRLGDAAHARVDAILRGVLYYSGAVLLLAVAAGVFLRAYLTGARERRHLALFPERNPSPVLRLDRAGGVVYANPGAYATLTALGGVDAAVAALLPADAPARLRGLIEGGHDSARWLYASLGREYEATVHYLRDIDLFHVYLTDVTARNEAERHMAFLAYHDPLTELPNRRRFVEDIAAAASEGQCGAVALLSLDRLRGIVEGVGHGVADRLLRGVAEHLRQVLVEHGELCPHARVYRFEGAVFGLLLPCIASEQAPEQLAERIVSTFQAPLALDGRVFHLGVSIGFSRYPTDDADAVNLISHADRALQQVKNRGGDGFQAYDRILSTQAAERLELENALRGALARDELFLVYQPQVDTRGGVILGAEALLRWRHPVLGLIPPSRFIPIAEEAGLIVPIGAWVLETACAQAMAWRRAGLPEIVLAVNLSARQFAHPQLGAEVERILAATGLPANALELEVTESMAMDDVEHAIAILRRLKQAGASIALDDFGTGYSSLAYLRRLPIDKLKVDQSFVRNLERDTGDAALVRAIVALGHSLDLRLIAEGVETAGQLAFLRETGCEEAQGFLLGHPLAADEFEALLKDHRAWRSHARFETNFF